MEKAQPGHTVEFQGLKGAAHLNGTKGTLVKFLKEEQRWSVRCDGGYETEVVKAKPENLVLVHISNRSENERDSDKRTASTTGAFASSSAATSHASGAGSPQHPSAWARGLSQKDRYEWFANCYQMRCDDDYQWGGCYLHGPYDPGATPQSVADDFFVYCVLAQRARAVPREWSWPAFLKVAAEYIPFAFEKSDAKERWGNENVFAAHMGGRSLRFTAELIYKSRIDVPGLSPEQRKAERDIQANKAQLLQELGGAEAWETLVSDLGRSSCFS